MPLEVTLNQLWDIHTRDHNQEPSTIERKLFAYLTPEIEATFASRAKLARFRLTEQLKSIFDDFAHGIPLNEIEARRGILSVQVKTPIELLKTP